MDDNSAEKSRNRWFGITCAILGLLVGVPTSYLFQSEMSQHGIGQYLARFEFFSDKTVAWISLGTIVSLGLAGFLFGLFVSGIVSGLKESKPRPSGSKPSPK